MKGRFLALIGLAVALAGCGRDGSAATLDAPIQLAPGQSALYESAKLEVKFVGIESDSRCPSDVACLWQGEATVRLAVRKDGRTQEVGIKETESLAVAGLTVTVLDVLPKRATSQAIAAADYRVTLKVAPANSH